MIDVLRNMFDVRREELPRFSLYFLSFFLFSMSMTWANSAARGVLGGDFIAAGQIYYGVLTILFSVAHAAFVDRVPKHLLLLVMTIMATVAVLAGCAFLYFGDRTAAVLALYVAYEIILLIWVQQWTNSILDFYDSRTSKRLLPLLGVSRLVGISFGGFVYPLLVGAPLNLGTDAMFVLWGVFMVLVFVILFLLPILMRDPKSEWKTGKEKIVDTLLDGVTYLAKTTFTRWMVVAWVLMNAQISLFQVGSKFLVDAHYAQIVSDQAAREAAVGAFFGQLDAWSALILLFVQIFVFPQVMKRYGLGNVNLIYPLVSFGAAGLVVLGALIPGGILGLFAGGAAYIDQNAFRRTFRTPVNSLLVNAVPPYVRGRVRTVINGMISPLANVAVGAMVQIPTFVVLGLVIETQTTLLVLTLIVSVVYALSAFALKREYGRAMVKLLKSEDYAALLSDDYELDSADPAMLQHLRERMQESDDPAYKRFIAGIILEAGGAAAVPLLVDTVSRSTAQDRLPVLQALEHYETRSDELRTLYIWLMNDDDREVRSLALRGLLNVTAPGEEIRERIAGDHLRDPDPRIRAAMLATLLQSANAGLRDKAGRVLRGMLVEYDPAVRLGGIEAIVKIGQAEQIRLLMPLLEDQDDTVRLEATRAILTLWRSPMPPEIIELLLKRETLLLEDPVEQIRELELAILARMNDVRFLATMVKALGDHSPRIRQSAMDALLGAGAGARPALLAAQDAEGTQGRYVAIALSHLDRKQYGLALQQRIEQTLQAIYHLWAVIAALESCARYPGVGILLTHYRGEIQHMQADLFVMLAALHDAGTVATIRETLQSQNKNTRSNAIEALESMTTPDLAKRVGALYEQPFQPQKIAVAYAEQSGEVLPVPETILRGLVTGDDIWLRAVGIMAMGEMAAENPRVRAIVTKTEPVPEVDAGALDPCQRAINADVLTVALRGAQVSHDEDVRLTALAVLRSLRGELLTLEHKENETMLSTIERMLYLKRVPYFQSLEVDQLQALAGICQEQTYKQGTRIFSQGDEGGALFIVISGKVDVGLPTKDNGGFTSLASYGSSSAFGEMSLFDGRPRSAAAVAAEDTLVLTLKRDPFLALTRQYPDLSVHFINELSERLRRANQRIVELDEAVTQASANL